LIQIGGNSPDDPIANHKFGIVNLTRAFDEIFYGTMTLEESMKYSKENVTRVTEQAKRAFLAGRKQ
jgi:hypothetical protein